MTSVVLREVPAEQLLAGRGTACFAAAADRGTLSDMDLCEAIVGALQRGLHPSPEERASIEAEASIERLGKWCGRAGVAASVAEILIG